MAYEDEHSDVEGESSALESSFDDDDDCASIAVDAVADCDSDGDGNDIETADGIAENEFYNDNLQDGAIATAAAKVIPSQSVVLSSWRGIEGKDAIQLPSPDGVERFLVFFNSDSTITFEGYVCLRVTMGAVNVLGKVINASSNRYDIYSPSWGGALKISVCEPINTIKKDNNDVITHSHKRKRYSARRADQSNGEDIKISDLEWAHSSVEAEVQRLCLNRRPSSTGAAVILERLVSPILDHFSTLPSMKSLLLPRATSSCTTKGIKDGQNMCLSDVVSLPGFAVCEDRNTKTFAGHLSRSLQISPQWIEVETTLNNHDCPVLLITGPKDCGKSTLSRYLTNHLLNMHTEIAYLDLDPGQPEFNPPGMIALHQVSASSPPLGPAFTHLQRPIDAYYTGNISPKDDPHDYLRGALQLIDSYHRIAAETKTGRLPLVINTIGWVRGMGMELLLELIRRLPSTHVIQIGPNTALPNANVHDARLSVDMPLLLPEFVWGADPVSQLSDPKSYFDLPEWPTPRFPIVYPLTFAIQAYQRCSSNISTPSSRTLRELSISMYFLETAKGHNAVPLTARTPYRVPWSSVSVSIEPPIPNEYILRALNVTVVGLIHVNGGEKISEDEDDTVGLPTHQMLRGGLKIVNMNSSGTFRRDISKSCVGIGLIRAIDTEHRLFYILTPELNMKHVDVIVRKGSNNGLDVPPMLLLQSGSFVGPYLTSEFSNKCGAGGIKRSSRRNVRRHSQHN